MSRLITEDGSLLFSEDGAYLTEESGGGTSLSSQSAVTIVADLVDEIQMRIPEGRIPTFFPSLNRAIGMLAKRLYMLESDLIVGELAVNIYAKVTYEAETIAFVNGINATADSITDSASQFLASGFLPGMPIISDSVGNRGPFRIVAASEGTLLLHELDSVTEKDAALCTLSSIDYAGYLPADFWGFVEKPYTVGYSWNLLPLPNQQAKLAYLTSSGMATGTPSYYALKGDRMEIYPATGSNIVIGGSYFKKPAKLTHMDDIVPFHGLFDDVLIEYLMMTLDGKLSVAYAELRGMLTDAVDVIVPKRQKRAAQSISGIDWNRVMEG